MFSSLSNRCLFRRRRILDTCRRFLTSDGIACSVNTKPSEDIQNVTVIGGGHMGSGIAQVCAQSGFNVTVFDSDEYAQKCVVNVMKLMNIISHKKFPDEPNAASKFTADVISCLRTTQYLEEACGNADIIIEAVIEDLDVKTSMFQRIDQLAPSYTIFASNTSSLSIKDIGSLTERPDRFGGMHFFNPVHKMKAVEVISTAETSTETVDTMCSFVRSIGKEPVKCIENEQTAGFIVNSFLIPYFMEALRTVERGEATIEDIDKAMKLGANLPLGPFELMDLIGIDNVKYIVDRWHEKYPENPKYYRSELLNTLYYEGKLGKKSGEGFYTYRPFYDRIG